MEDLLYSLLFWFCRFRVDAKSSYSIHTGSPDTAIQGLYASPEAQRNPGRGIQEEIIHDKSKVIRNLVTKFPAKCRVIPLKRGLKPKQKG